MTSIRMSPKHGVNPSMGVCFVCGDYDGTIRLGWEDAAWRLLELPLEDIP